MSGLFTSLAVMLSPTGLAAAGNGAGAGGVAFMAALAVAAFASFFTAAGMENLGSGKIRATPVDGFVFGFLDSARLFTITLLAASWLGMAGNTVSEIFAPWMPAQAAGFILLGLTVISCFIADENGADVFTFCLTIGVCAFIYVMVMSVQPADSGAGYPTTIPALFPTALPENLSTSGMAGWLQIIFLAAFAFAGFEMPTAFENKAARVIPAVLLALIAFILFCWSALLIVPAGELAESSTPYLLVAGSGLGELGKYLTGGAVVLATVAALLGFYMLAGKRLESILAEDYQMHATKGAAVVLAVAVGLLFGTEFEAETTYETMLAAGLCFWFGTYVLTDLLHMSGKMRTGRKISALITDIPGLLLHTGAAAFCIMSIELHALFYYALGGLAVAGIIFGLGTGICYRPAPEITDESEFDEYDQTLDSEETAPESEDESLNIVDYR
ncbi:APC family permease [Maridesulfovibrio sp.]|uniref:APC family permease n=1 Tax=Maridesulfovibrio sp. TaxID=2795000 RepID=UPI002A189FE4|nr:APC family permease [Maridesulfovibrio sp.]